MKKFSYRGDIDGLRAIAVLGVLFFHSGLGCSGGFVGVDVFFVISGFLITGLILRDLREGTFSFVEFWARRIQRIVPALAVITLAVVVIGYFGMVPADYEGLGQQVIALVLCISNIKFWKETGYFDDASGEKPLLHTWSLSVEEQFYFIIPIALFLVFKFRRESLALVIIAFACIASFAASVYASYYDPSKNFYLLPTRAWELGAGSLLAFAHPIASSKLREVCGFIGLALILGCFFFFSEDLSFPGAFALPPVLGAVLLIWSGIGQTKLPGVGYLLTLKPIIGIGLISYSLYLWHWPIFAYQKYLGYSNESQTTQFILLLTSLAAAYLSWRFVENPFRRQTIRQNKQGLIVFGLSYFALLFIVGLTKSSQQRLSSRFSEKILDRALLENGHKRYVSNGMVGRYLAGDSKSDNLVYVWGDSHAMAILPALVQPMISFERVLYDSTRASTPPILNFERIRNGKEAFWDRGQKQFNEDVLEDIRVKSRNYKTTTVIITGAFEQYEKIDGFKNAFIKSAERLKANGVDRLVVMIDVPFVKGFSPKPFYLPLSFLSSKPKINQETIPRISLEDYLKQRKKMDEVLSLMPPKFVHIIDPARILMTGENFFSPVINCSKGKLIPIYLDHGHLNVRGAELFREALFDAIQEKRN